MTDVISFWVSITSDLWTLIVQHWLLSISVLITVLNMVITVVNNTRGGGNS